MTQPGSLLADPDALRLALRASGVGLWALVDGTFEWDPQTCALFRREHAPSSIDAYLDAVHGDDRDRVRGELASLLATGAPRDLEHRLSGRGDARWVLCKATALRHGDGSMRGLMGIAIDVTEHRRAEAQMRSAHDSLATLTRELEELSITDELTRLPNRRHLFDTLEREWHRGLRSGAPIALALCDIDDFKAFNDCYGHLQGDQSLRVVSRALHNALRRPGDVIARYGGEEFLAVLPDTDREGATTVAERMRARVQALDIEHLGNTRSQRLTISVGVASTIPRSDASLEDLLQLADAALYRAKRGGRNRSVTADDLGPPVAAAQTS